MVPHFLHVNIIELLSRRIYGSNIIEPIDLSKMSGFSLLKIEGTNIHKILITPYYSARTIVVTHRIF